VHRVVQWATGNVGRHALRAIIERPDLELVGVRVYDPAKVGRDAGELVGSAPVGVSAVDSIEVVLTLRPDCVVYTSIDPLRGAIEAGGALANVCTLLAAGCNVVATTPSYCVYPTGGPPAAMAHLEAACAEGGATFFGSGASPGFTTEILPLTLLRFARTVERIWVLESLSMAAYSSPAVMGAMGFGLGLDQESPMDRSNAEDRLPTSGRGTSIRMLADALGVELDAVTYRRESAVADHPVECAVGRIEPGGVVASRLTFTGLVKGIELIVHEFVWRLDDQVRPDWPVGDKTLFRIDGDPTMTSELVVETQFDSRRSPSLLAAMGVVNAIPAVCAAAPGVRTALDLPLWAGALVTVQDA
jgi:2,4-diaminopentanoate dehydrogenase